MRPLASPSPFEILVEDPRYLIVHKAPGIPFHTQEGEEGLLAMLRKEGACSGKEALDKTKRIFAVHRLDRVTSGLLLFARGAKNADLLGNLFRHRRVDKIYLALSDRKAKKKSGTISGAMVPSRRGAWRLTREKKNLAKTSFFSLPIPERRTGLRLYVIKPFTGRTHQIRVAMKSIGAPILGDGLYSHYELARQEERSYLHAYALRFFLGDEEVSIVDPPRPGLEFASQSFQKVLGQLGGLPEILARFKST